MSRVRELKKYLHDVLVRGRQNLFLFRLGRDLFLLEQKDSKWIDYHSFKDKHIFLLEKNVSHVKELNNTLTMLSSEDDRICSSSVWVETSFWLNKNTVNKIIIILLKRCIFSYWKITCHVSRVTELQKYLNDVVVRSWQNMHVFRLGRDSLLLKKKNRKWIDNHSFKTSTFSYWTRMCHVSHSLKYTFTMLLSGVDKVRWSSVEQKRSIFCHPWPQTSFCWNKMTVHWISLWVWVYKWVSFLLLEVKSVLNICFI